MNTVRVGFDDQIFVAQPRGGFSKYFVELVKRLPEEGIEPVMLPRWTRNLHLGESGLVPMRDPKGRIGTKVDWALWRIVGRPRAQARTLPPLDVLHHTFTHPAYLGTWKGPRVVTIVDMTPELYPELFPLGNPHLAKRRFAAKADALVTISDNTAADMVRLYGNALAPKVETIYLGVGDEFLVSSEAHTLTLPTRFVLFVGVRNGYKDFAIAVATVSALRARPEFADLAFVTVGGPAFTEAERELLERNGLTRDTIQLRPTDNEMPEVYRRASLFLFPSRYEGFGMPTLEALASGTPTVLADASCSREVGGTVAMYATPGDSDDWVTQSLAALETENVARVKVDGPVHSRRFTWAATAKAHAELYRTLAQARA